MPGRAGRHCAGMTTFPILSYITLGARCRSCRTRISVRYPLVEIATAAAFIGHYVVFGWTPLLAVRLMFAAAMIALFVIDLEHHLLPDAITLPGIVVGLVASLFLPPGFVASLIAAPRGRWLFVDRGGGVLPVRWPGGDGWRRRQDAGDDRRLSRLAAHSSHPDRCRRSSVRSIGLLIVVLRFGGMKSPLPFGTFLALAALARIDLG